MKLIPAAGAAALALLVSASPAAAQSAGAAPAGKRNTITVGVGGAYLPTYEGSDDYGFSPVGFAFGKVAGIGFATRGTALYVNVVPSGADDVVKLEFGPVANLRLDRSHGIKDRQVDALGHIGPAVELGGYAGIAKKKVLHAYDTLTFEVAVTKDVTDTHHSMIVTPTIDYMTPISTTTAVDLSASAEHVGGGFADTYYGVTPAGALRSGLPVYDAHGGWKNWRLSLIAAHVLTGDLRNPHLSVFAGVSYSRVLGNFARSPVVSVAGTPSQFAGGGGLAYTF